MKVDCPTLKAKVVNIAEKREREREREKGRQRDGRESACKAVVVRLMSAIGNTPTSSQR
jgi:hypothetical protein